MRTNQTQACISTAFVCNLDMPLAGYQGWGGLSVASRAGLIRVSLAWAGLGNDSRLVEAAFKRESLPSLK